MVDVANAAVLAILTRAPSSGGKSRLFAALGRPPNPDLLSALLLDTVDGAATPGVCRLVVVTPGSACAEVQQLLGPATDVQTLPQPDGDLGDRMRGTLAALFEKGARAVALIGSDLPHITSAPIASAFSIVARDADALVLGPAADGGYYLIAARRLPDVFSRIAWGTAEVLAQTERQASALGFHIHHLPLVADVDTVSDLRDAVSTRRAHRTAAWVARNPLVVD